MIPTSLGDRDHVLVLPFLTVLHHEPMFVRLDWPQRSLSVLLGVITLIGVCLLLVWDLNPGVFPARAHAVLGAFPLALIAVAYLAYQSVRKPAPKELVKAALLSVAFLLWAANQLWPEFRGATLCNDLAIALFVLDVFLVIVGWPATSPDESFAETYDARIGGRQRE